MCCLINDLYCLENAFVYCRLLSPQTPTGALPLDTAGGLPSLRPPVPTLPPNPGYATGVISASLYVLRRFVYCVTVTVYLLCQITLLCAYCSSARLAHRWLNTHCPVYLFKYVTTRPPTPPSLMFHFLKSSRRSLPLEARSLA